MTEPKQIIRCAPGCKGCESRDPTIQKCITYQFKFQVDDVIEDHLGRQFTVIPHYGLIRRKGTISLTAANCLYYAKLIRRS